MSYSLGLTSGLAPILSNEETNIYISSTRVGDNALYWGSSEPLDNRISWKNAKVTHMHGEYGRAEKISTFLSKTQNFKNI